MKVSIVTNVYNEERNLREYFESLQKQTFKDYELIMVYDESTDNTLKIIEEYKEKFNMKIIKLQHVGLREARRIGFDKAAGDIIFILDADITFHENAIETLLKCFEDPEVAIASYHYYYSGNTWAIKGYNFLRDLSLKLRENGKFAIDWIGGGACAYRKKMIDEIGGLAQGGEIQEDTDILWKIQQKGLKAEIVYKNYALHKESGRIIDLMKKEYKYGKQQAGLFSVHKKRFFRLRTLVTYYPLITIILFLYSWKLALILMFIAFLGSYAIFFRIVKSPFSYKIYAFIDQFLIYLSWSLGFLKGRIIATKIGMNYKYMHSNKI